MSNEQELPSENDIIEYVKNVIKSYNALVQIEYLHKPNILEEENTFYRLYHEIGNSIQG